MSARSATSYEYLEMTLRAIGVYSRRAPRVARLYLKQTIGPLLFCAFFIVASHNFIIKEPKRMSYDDGTLCDRTKQCFSGTKVQNKVYESFDARCTRICVCCALCARNDVQRKRRFIIFRLSSVMSTIYSRIIEPCMDILRHLVERLGQEAAPVLGDNTLCK